MRCRVISCLRSHCRTCRDLNPIGSPEELLRRRPDIRAAERNSRLQRHASVSPSAICFRKSLHRLDRLQRCELWRSWQRRHGNLDLRAQHSWAAFDLGRVRARIDIAEAQAGAALAGYESTVLNGARRDGRRAGTYGSAQTRRATLEEAAAASSRAAGLARRRFEGGLADFLNVSSAERDALLAQDGLAESRTQVATSLIAVYKALGGGWVE